ncbi:LysR substrate-binding domain-containing protein [Undibacterium sp. Tian12W]|uniref:LysR family transcriptional regulator n=1 Tax=Undibacterium sp. Tian12W TaxID=3413054 RepID=UPI003BEF7DA7
MDRFAAINTFVKVVEKGSFAAAADATNLSAPMVGNHIRYLEAHLGGLLLNRTTRRQKLTELGMAFYERCKTIMAELEGAEADALGLHAAPRGILRVTAPHSIGSVVLPVIITAYLEKHPEVEIELVLNDSRVDLLDQGFDVAIRGGELPNSGLIGRSLAPLRLVPCASPAYIARCGEPKILADLAQHQCVDFTGSSTPGVWFFVQATGQIPVSVRGRLRVNSGHSQRAAVLGGLGIALLAEVLVSDDLLTGKLVRVLPHETPLSRPLHVLMLPNRRPSAKIRSFVDFLAAELKS